MKGAQPFLRSAEREILLSALFFLIAFSFAPPVSKEKAANRFARYNISFATPNGLTKGLSCRDRRPRLSEKSNKIFTSFKANRKTTPFAFYEKLAFPQVMDSRVSRCGSVTLTF